jgi:tetratricopeptide (TPR) repeat protein
MFTALVFLNAQSFKSDGYASIADIYKADENAGLTAFPVLMVPMGGRAEAMGTAYTALADDLSFIEWNPAGSSRLPRTELGFFHNNWIADTKVEGAVFASRYKDLGYGAGGKWLYTPFSEYNMYGNRVSKGYYSEAVGILNVSYNFFSGYYFSGLSLGANLKGAFRFMPDYSDADDQGRDGGKILSGLSQSAAMVMADLGILTRFNLIKLYKSREQNTSVALTIRNLGPPAKGEPLPTLATAALAYKPLRPVTLAFDFTFPLNLQDLSLREKPYWAAGINVEVTDFLAMRTGVLGRYGGYRITLGSAVDLGKIALDLNYSLDLLTQITPLNRVSLGLRFNFGDQGRLETAKQVDALYLAGLDAYTEGRIEDARKYWEDALRLNPKFDPAREGITLVNNTDELNTRILNMRILDAE